MTSEHEGARDARRADAPDGAGDARERRFYGRRRGHKLRPARRALIETALPPLRVDPRGRLDDVFPAPTKAIWLEIGFGAGEHLARQAQAHPEVGFIGCEPFENGVASLLSVLTRDGIENVRIYDDDARHLFAMFPDASVERVFILFPDPWPKVRHHKRRFINAENLAQIARILKDGGELRFASDHMDYVRWTLFHVLSRGDFTWAARRPDDWRTPPPDWAPTRYEEKALTGARPAYLRFLRRDRERSDEKA